MIEWLMNNQWLIYLIIGAVGVKIGWKMHEAWMVWIIREHPERMEMAVKLAKTVNTMTDSQLDDFAEQLKQARQEGAVKGEGVEMSIERVGDVLYAYAKDTGQFLAQGSTLADLISATEKRFPGKKFFGTIAKDNSAKELAQ